MTSKTKCQICGKYMPIDEFGIRECETHDSDWYYEQDQADIEDE